MPGRGFHALNRRRSRQVVQWRIVVSKKSVLSGFRKGGFLLGHTYNRLSSSATVILVCQQDAMEQRRGERHHIDIEQDEAMADV
jgi:hypothetical protein